jgi:prepilin-type N-terminal cleavage/methylation domain-containing protein
VKRRGFSLLEVLVAIGLITLLFGALFGFLFDILASRTRALDHAGRQLAATTLIDGLERDLASCVVGDRNRGAGVEGSETSLRILTRGVAVHLADRGRDDPLVLGDLQQVEYRFDDATGQIEARRAGPDDRAANESSFAPLGRAVSKLRFRYRDDTGWRDSFDSLADDRLPLAVEIAVWFHPWPGEETPDPETDLEFEVPERLTFDAEAGFDEAAYARESDLELFDEPGPNRFRVIVIPDASSDDPFAVEESVP